MNGSQQNHPSSSRRATLKRATFILFAAIGVAACLIAITRTDDDPIGSLLAQWPVVAAAGAFYLAGISFYAASWASLFGESENRTLIALAFLISQPMKYLPGGFAQPVGQVTLTAQATDSTRKAVVAFPVHVLINVVVAMTLGAPLLFVLGPPRWTHWLLVLVPLVWTALNRRWMKALLSLLGRVHRVFQVSSDLPTQRHINSAFALAVMAHGLMFASFGVLAASPVAGWNALQLGFAYAIAWLVGYVALPAPAGLGAREASLVLFLGGAVSSVTILRIATVHRIATLIIELAVLAVALPLTRKALNTLYSAGRPTTEARHLPRTNDKTVK